MRTQHAAGTRTSTPAPARTSGAPALDALRRRTRAAHEGLDAALSGPGGSIVDTAGYVRLLTTLSTLHAHTDEPLHGWAARSGWVSDHLDLAVLPRRRDLYASDLARLGASPRPTTVRATPCDDGRALGLLYVVAGSTKGARMVLRGLPDDLAPDARAGLSDAAAPGAARLWQGCRSVLTTPLPEELVARAADEAERLFTLLREGVH
ncbi:biliverdin-producing heme oxygenase [Nocardioides sp. HDW12B]|uniref:biliverdin-producing heme oxygenase n=1 Tax=Nocardioides sp. HDW12B TaxID=2714939 RepID=UPI0014075595|nr:biliverdin-producing heme oxygenase [Nocardioides sp. HDW12B]QIK65604.1 biliverdin-producing heme oxygenase [Nocardioides sp. HDW12B]